MSERDAADILDEELSALVDGELDAERARQLRARVAAEPAIAERIEIFEALNAALADLPTSQLSEQRATFEERLAARIAADADAGRVVALESRRARRWLVPAAAALAAGLALYLVLPGGSTPRPAPRIAQHPAPPHAEPELAEASELELGVAFDLETLDDFEVIDQLELLERLVALDAGSGSDGGRG